VPLVDIDARRAYRREEYRKKKEYYLEKSKARRLRLQRERAEEKAREALVPKPPLKKLCAICGADISATHKKKAGMKCPPCIAAHMKKYREDNAERISRSKREWSIKNFQRKADLDKAYAEKYPEKRTAARKKWEKLNPLLNLVIKRENQLRRKNRVPGWLSEDDRWMIKEVYDLAAVRTELFSFSWHVDHIIPLNGKKVSGLHVPENLQVIPWRDNLKKGATYG